MKQICKEVKAIGVILAVAAMALGFGYLVFADWTPPTLSPPQGNVPTPINVGSQDQEKTARLGATRLSANQGYLYFGSTHYSAPWLASNQSGALYWRGAHSTTTQMIFQDNEATIYGRIYGDGDGSNFGLLDGGGRWNYLAVLNNYTQLRVAGETGLHLLRVGAGDIRLGIQTTTPGYRLHVNGNAYADQYFCAATDLAERTPATQKFLPGEVVCLSAEQEGKLSYCQDAYDVKVAGVVSTNPAIILGDNPSIVEVDSVDLALAGRVPVKVSGENGNIQVGDLLTSSSLAGHAMRGDNETVSSLAGVVLGKAMESFSGDQGEILMLILLR